MNIILFYYFYIIISFFSINFLIVINEIKNKNIKYACSLVIMTFLGVLFGFRGFDVGTDTKNYIDYFRDQNSIYQVREPLFELLRILDNTHNFENFSFSLLALSLITNYSFLYAFKKFSVNYPIVLALFISTFVYINANINIIRQGFAMSMCAIAISLLICLNKEKTRYWILGISAHYSSLIVFAISFIHQKITRASKIYYAISLFCLGALYFFDIKILLEPFVNHFTAIQNAYWLLSWSYGKEWTFKHIYYLIALLILITSCIDRYSKNKFSVLRRKQIISYLLFGFLASLIFKADEMFVDRIFYYFLFLIPVILADYIGIIGNKFLSFPLILIGCNLWLFKTLFIQFPVWFIFPYAYLDY